MPGDYGLASMMNAFGPETTVSGAMQIKAEQDAKIREQQARAANLDASTNETNLLAPFRAKKAQYESSDAFQQADLGQKNAAANWNNANAAKAWNDLDQAKKEQIIGDSLNVTKQIAQAGVLYGSQGKDGKMIASEMIPVLESKLQQAKTPEQQKQIQTIISQLQSPQFQSYTPQQVMTESQKILDNVMKQDPKVVMTKMHIDSNEKIAGMHEAGANSRAKMLAESKGNAKPPKSAEEALTRQITEKYVSGEYTHDQYMDELAKVFNRRTAKPTPPGIGASVDDKGNISLNNKGGDASPAYVPGKGKNVSDDDLIKKYGGK